MYSYLEQRMAQSYIDLLPPFIPDDKADYSIVEQEEFYLLIKKLYQLAYNEPLLFVATLHEDDFYPNRFNKSSYGKPELLANMKKFLKSMDALLNNMFLMGQGIDVKLNKREKVILSRLEINSLADITNVWKWMSSRPGSNILDFSHCFFKKEYPYTADIYSNLLGSLAFRKLENWMFEHGYKGYNISDITASDCNLSLTYANPKWSKEQPKGGFLFKIKHSGISVEYDKYAKKPPILGLCIPNSYKTYLDNFETMDPRIKSFVLSHTKKCDGCRYCVQTDKTGEKPLACVKVIDKNNHYNLCPYFPGYGYCWTNIDEEIVDDIIMMLSYIDRFIE